MKKIYSFKKKTVTKLFTILKIYLERRRRGEAMVMDDEVMVVMTWMLWAFLYWYSWKRPLALIATAILRQKRLTVSWLRLNFWLIASWIRWMSFTGMWNRVLLVDLEEPKITMDFRFEPYKWNATLSAYFCGVAPTSSSRLTSLWNREGRLRFAKRSMSVNRRSIRVSLAWNSESIWRTTFRRVKCFDDDEREEWECDWEEVLTAPLFCKLAACNWRLGCEELLAASVLLAETSMAPGSDSRIVSKIKI